MDDSDPTETPADGAAWAGRLRETLAAHRPPWAAEEGRRRRAQRALQERRQHLQLSHQMREIEPKPVPDSAPLSKRDNGTEFDIEAPEEGSS